MRNLVRFPAAVAAVALVAACEGEPTGYSGQVSVEQFFSAVYAVLPEPGGEQPAARVTGKLAKLAGAAPARVAAAASEPTQVAGAVREGPYPRQAGAPGATIEMESSIVTTMPARVRLVGEGPFTHIAFTVAGAGDYWEIVLPAPVTEVLLIPTAASGMPNLFFPLEVAVGTSAGYGAPSQEGIQAVDLANSDVAVILRWNALSDVDLHVTDANGEKIYFANPRSEEGGQLDLDSNAACNLDGVNQEVISWPLNRAPFGEYKVEVDYWSDCGVARSDYTVTFMVRGRTLQVVTGFFEGESGPTSRHEAGRFSFP